MKNIKFAIVLVTVMVGLNFITSSFADRYSSEKSNQNKNDTAFLEKAWGTPAPATLYLGMVTLHINEHSRSNDNWNNQLIAATYDGYFAGTLLNSFYDRAYVAGIQRVFFSQQISENFSQSVGYRIGFISGYDERMMSFAKNTPVLPFPQLIYDLSWKHAGVEFGLLPMAATAGLFYQF